MNRVSHHTIVAALAALGVLSFGGCRDAGESVNPDSTLEPGKPSFTPSSGIINNQLVRATFDAVNVHAEYNGDRFELKTKQTSDVVVVQSSMDPGGTTGWHFHPGPIIVAMTGGALTLYDGDDRSCAPHVFPAGTGFVDQGGGHVHIARNEGSVAATWVSTTFAPVGGVTRIDADAPGNCPF